MFVKYFITLTSFLFVLLLIYELRNSGHSHSTTQEEISESIQANFGKCSLDESKVCRQVNTIPFSSPPYMKYEYSSMELEVYEEVENEISGMSKTVTQVHITSESETTLEMFDTMYGKTSKTHVIKPKRKKFGDKSLKQCQQLNLRKGSMSDLLDSYVRIYHGKPTSPSEFPHMAALGYGEPYDIKWVCGGSLISNFYVLTAAHCIQDDTYGEVKYVRLGDSNLTVSSQHTQVFKAENKIIHPKYMFPKKYHDIALIRLNRAAKITSSVKPVCLVIEDTAPKNQPIVCGFGACRFADQGCATLMKVTIDFFSYDACKRSYPPRGFYPMLHYPFGILEDVQICAGGKVTKGDACGGDSGGPLQVKQDNMYYLLGITSFGSYCGVLGIPAVYTKIPAYIEWIESIVWPEIE